MTRLSGKLPKGDADGLSVLGRALVSDPSRLHYVIAVVDCSQITTDCDTGEVEGTARIRRIEAAPDEHHPFLAQVLARALELRCPDGEGTLPIDVTRSPSPVGGVWIDLATGELHSEEDP